MQFNPEAWASSAKEAGMKYLVFTTKHHDGFCLWDTKTTDRKVTKSPLGRDVLVCNDETLDRPAAELVEKDLKEFAGSNTHFAVAQVETVDRTRIDSAHLEKFADALRVRRQRCRWDFPALLITDIFRSDSIVLFDVRNSALARLLGPSGEVWAGCVSRKKQFLPELLRRLNPAEPG